MLTRTAATTALLFAAASCGTAPSPTPTDTPAHQLSSWMVGAFSSQAQSLVEPSYFAIRLVAYPIWVNRADGPWLYVEQASEDGLDQPYRQRVYHFVNLEGGDVRSDIYSLPEGEDSSYVAAWRKPGVFDNLSPAHLRPRTGCSVYMKLDETDSMFQGSTRNAECQSTLEGATYATARVTVTREGMRRWDQGFDAEGEQVWGAEAGPYRFDRITIDSLPVSGLATPAAAQSQ